MRRQRRRRSASAASGRRDAARARRSRRRSRRRAPATAPPGPVAGGRRSPQPGDTDQPAVGPVVGLELPDAGVGLMPALLDRARPRSRRRATPSASRWSWSAAAASSSSASPNASSWNCWLTQLPTTSLAARVAGQAERRLVGHRVAGRPCRRGQLGAVGEQAIGDEPHRVVQQRQRTGLGDRLPGEALVTDPHVAVVVVASLAGALGQRHGGGGDHPAARRWSAPAARRRRGGHPAPPAPRELGQPLCHAARSRSRRVGIGGGSPSPSASSTSTRSWVSPSGSSASSPERAAVRRPRAARPRRRPSSSRARRAARRASARRRSGAAAWRPRPVPGAQIEDDVDARRALDAPRPVAESRHDRGVAGSASASGTRPPPSSVIQRLRQIRPCS